MGLLCKQGCGARMRFDGSCGNSTCSAYRASQRGSAVAASQKRAAQRRAEKRKPTVRRSRHQGTTTVEESTAAHSAPTLPVIMDVESTSARTLTSAHSTATPSDIFNSVQTPDKIMQLMCKANFDKSDLKQCGFGDHEVSLICSRGNCILQDLRRDIKRNLFPTVSCKPSTAVQGAAARR